MNYFSRSINNIIEQALREDIGKSDITTKSIIPEDKYVKAILQAKEDCVICGLNIAREVFRSQNKNIKFKPRVSDGQKIKKGKTIAYISGKAQGILTAERVALNFLSLLSGVATKTRVYVDKVKPYKVRILDTRKTIPGLRELEKYAIRTGGGYNHRMRLDEMVLVKDNHLKILRHKTRRIRQEFWRKTSKFKIKDLRKRISKNIKIEIEVKNLREFKEALEARPDIIMLDNMKIIDIEKAVRIRNTLSSKTRAPSPKLEASGGISLKNVRKVAATGVEIISLGTLTHSINSIDISLEIL